MYREYRLGTNRGLETWRVRAQLREQGCRDRRRTRAINTALSASEGTTTTHWASLASSRAPHSANVQDPHQPCRAASPSKPAARSVSVSPQSCPAWPWALLGQSPVCPHPACLSPWPAQQCPWPRAALLPGQGGGTGAVPALPALHQTPPTASSRGSWTKLGLGTTKKMKTWYLMYLKGTLHL